MNALERRESFLRSGIPPEVYRSSIATAHRLHSAAVASAVVALIAVVWRALRGPVWPSRTLRRRVVPG